MVTIPKPKGIPALTGLTQLPSPDMIKGGLDQPNIYVADKKYSLANGNKSTEEILTHGRPDGTDQYSHKAILRLCLSTFNNSKMHACSLSGEKPSSQGP